MHVIRPGIRLNPLPGQVTDPGTRNREGRRLTASGGDWGEWRLVQKGRDAYQHPAQTDSPTPEEEGLAIQWRGVVAGMP